MKTRNNIMVIDTETVGTFGQPLVHDLGYVIIDKDFNVLKKDRFLTKELHGIGHWILKTSDFYKEYDKDYKHARETEKVLKWADISKAVADAIKEYKVSTISAYNLQFDYKAIHYTDELFNGKHLSKVLDHKTKNLLCIYNLACETVLNTDEYRNFCSENGYISESGNFRTGAEFAYRYIVQDTEYIEKHTALADAEDETVILKYIVNTVKGKPNYGLYYNCWKKAQG